MVDTTQPPTFLMPDLTGIDLPDGWSVIERFQEAPGHTRGSMSSQYVVRNVDGRSGFLKTPDLSWAAQQLDFVRALEELSQSFNFERDVLLVARRMDRVVTAISDGRIEIPGALFPVQYIIFELASGDVRTQMDLQSRISPTWALRTLHHISVGLRQLHDAQIAHQDIKPSNILVFSDDATVADAKIGDVGRASRRDVPVSHDEYPIPGAPFYAPLQLLYGEVNPDWDQRRRAADLFLFGSMIGFVFSGVTTTAAVVSKLDGGSWPMSIGGGWAGTYREILPVVRDAFNEAMESIRSDFPIIVREDLEAMMRQLCNPDPLLRGHPRNHVGHDDRYSLHRFTSQLDLLAKRASIAHAG